MHLFHHYSLADTGRAVGIALHRPWGDKPFGAREVGLVDLFHQAQPLYRNVQVAPPVMPRRGLTPRQQDVLWALRSGDSEKQVAAKLGVSIHTVHVYVKAIYRHFNVNSRGELMSFWARPA